MCYVFPRLLDKEDCLPNSERNIIIQEKEEEDFASGVICHKSPFENEHDQGKLREERSWCELKEGDNTSMNNANCAFLLITLTNSNDSGISEKDSHQDEISKQTNSFFSGIEDVKQGESHNGQDSVNSHFKEKINKHVKGEPSDNQNKKEDLNLQLTLSNNDIAAVSDRDFDSRCSSFENSLLSLSSEFHGDDEEREDYCSVMLSFFDYLSENKWLCGDLLDIIIDYQ